MREDAIYARQSVDRIDSISIESQIEYCKYETRGASCRVYADKGYSGKTAERPQFQQMLAAVRNGEIGRVICYKLDRCSRSILDFANMIDVLQHHQVEFISCTEKFDTSSPMGRAMLNICIVFAQLERETIQQRVADAYHSRSQRGFYMGGRIPYGFRLEPYMLHGKKTSRYTVCPEEAEVLREIYRLYAHPQTSLGDIMNHLRESGIQNTRRKDGVWTKSSLSSILRNPVYVQADMEIYSFYREKDIHILNPPDDFIGTNGCYLFSGKSEPTSDSPTLIIAPHQGLLPSGLWLKCRRKLMNNRQVAKPVKARQTWLAGKIKCPLCGYALVSKTDRYNRYYMCSRHLSDRCSCEGVGALKADELDGIILDVIKEKLHKFGTFSPRKTSCDVPQVSELKTRIIGLENEIDSYLAKLADANSVLTGYINDKVSALDERKKQCQEQLAQAEKQQLRSASCSMDANDCIRLWDKLEIKDKLAIVDALISVIKASKREIIIYWKL